MENHPACCSADLRVYLDSEPEEIGKDDPFYWYFHLKALGKRAQTEEMAEEAVNGFTVTNHSYAILEVVAKKYISRDMCAIAVGRNGLNLKYVPERYRDVGICLTAVKNDGDALGAVPESILLGDCGYEICLAAVSNDFAGRALSFVPDCYLRGKKGSVLYEAAVRANGYALEYVPKRRMTKELVKLAIETPLPVKEELWPDGLYSTRRPNSFYSAILSFVPKKFLSEELVALSVRLYPESLRCVPPEFASRDLFFEAIERNPMNLRYVPEPDDELVDRALKANPQVITVVPESLLTMKRCRDALRRDPGIPIDKFPEDIRKEMEMEFCSDPFVSYESVALETPDILSGDKQMVSYPGELRAYDVGSGDGPVKSIYYISDIHLEHQLSERPGDIVKLSLPEIRDCIDEKISELLASVPDSNGLLLIGGDVADSVELEELFYKRLTSFSLDHPRWNGKIVAVLGNHELWDGDPAGLKHARSVDEIVSSYRQVMPYRVTLLENELYIAYKGIHSKILDENMIADASIEELAGVCADSTLIILGGIGFSGLNPVYNAGMGLYRSTVSMEEDAARSKRFRAIYEKILACARDLPVIVLTHTQMADWSDAQYNPKWVYVSGHTHQNSFLLQQDGTAVFSDNQVGYRPTRWHLNCFTIDAHRYDPFKDYPDGVHRITNEQYIEFNRCQGITMKSMKHPGSLYALKRDGVYMFVLEGSRSLCLLAGGRRQKLDCDIGYYYDNLPEYIRKVRSAFEPYQKALSMVSSEVKAIGGSGVIHGCIVDIDFFNHVYVNPFDGKLTPYFASNTIDKLMFDNVESLLLSSPCPPRSVGGELLFSRYLAMTSREEGLPVLSRGANNRLEIAVVPQVVLDRSMYEPSRIMRSIQYIFEQNVLRVWKDEVFDVDDGVESPILPSANSLPASQF